MQTISEDSFEGDNAGVLIINLKSGGVATITVRATDTDRGWVEEEFRLTVRDVPPNNAPQLIGNIPDLTLYLDDAGYPGGHEHSTSGTRTTSSCA